MPALTNKKAVKDLNDQEDPITAFTRNFSEFCAKKPWARHLALFLTTGAFVVASVAYKANVIDAKKPSFGGTKFYQSIPKNAN